MITGQTVIPLSPREQAEYGAERVKDEAFDQVCLLWDRRQSEGWTKRRLADEIGRDPAWVSRMLSAPGNWTFRTFGTFVQGLHGDAYITVRALEDEPDTIETDPLPTTERNGGTRNLRKPHFIWLLWTASASILF